MMKAVSRAHQLAEAYERVALANHYMVDIGVFVSKDELFAIHQILIQWHNATSEKTRRRKRLELALDILTHDARQRGIYL